MSFLRSCRALASRALTAALGLIAAAAVALACGGGTEPSEPLPTRAPTAVLEAIGPAPTSTRTAEPPATATPEPTLTPRPPSRPTSTPLPTTTPSPKPVLEVAPVPTAGELATLNAVALAATELGLPADEFSVHSVEAVDWSDTSLGCPEPGVLYAQVIVPGWEISLVHEDRLFKFHADEAGDQVITCDPSVVGPGLPTIDLVREAGIGSATRLVVSTLDPDGLTTETRVVDDPARLHELVTALSEPTSLTPPEHCTPVYLLEFETPSGTVAFEYRCEGSGNMIRGDHEFWLGQDGIAPIIFRATMSIILADKPFPAFPPDSSG